MERKSPHPAETVIVLRGEKNDGAALRHARYYLGGPQVAHVESNNLGCPRVAYVDPGGAVSVHKSFGLSSQLDRLLARKGLLVAP